jgi:hypothetical protein
LKAKDDTRAIKEGRDLRRRGAYDDDKDKIEAGISSPV